MTYTSQDTATAASIKRYVSGLADEGAIATGLLSALIDRSSYLPNADMGEAIALLSRMTPEQLSHTVELMRGAV